ncbi:hypothetical protein C9374_013552 [Naegleria lovaniensis]|uniref:Rhodanese domain-containing protein n=1 Tax=Naegleria lovaniensis TaxID=51637 RepID=A0AA88H2I4_NAELO|nr:uncharacterized protein C9374_013552 [Naegleria lovaniensis]KAG2392067.1 hypothetical protein C9374_013552 [Naegleria lovaniensis]
MSTHHSNNNNNNSNDDHCTLQASSTPLPLNIIQSGKISKQELRHLITSSTTPNQLSSQQQQQHYILLDVRSHQEVRGHHPLLPTAKHIPINLIYSAFEAEDDEFEMEFGFCKPQQQDLIIVYCEHGIRSQMVQQILTEEFGYQHVINYEGSAHDWYSERN